MPTVPTSPAHLRARCSTKQHQLGDRRGRVAAAVHRRGAGVAGHADHLADVAHAAVDRGDDAERQVELVEHRALLDVHFDEAKVLRRVALSSGCRRCTGRRAPSPRAWSCRRRPSGRARPGRTGRPARPSPGKSPCSAGLPLRRSRRPRCRTAGGWPARVQLAHAGHRHQDAEPAVVLAAVAHGVVVAAGQQAPGAAVRCRGRRRPRCRPHRSRPRRSRNRAHPVRQRCAQARCASVR